MGASIEIRTGSKQMTWTLFTDCSGAGGYPPPNLQAAIGPSNQYTNDDMTLERIQQDSRYDENTDEVTMYSLFKYVPSIDHQDYYVKCIAIQSAYQDQQVVDVYPMQVCIFNRNLLSLKLNTRSYFIEFE